MTTYEDKQRNPQPHIQGFQRYNGRSYVSNNMTSCKDKPRYCLGSIIDITEYDVETELPDDDIYRKPTTV